ncbi:MAG: FHA domain-containing protein [bacterium]|nr:FHA domain-containing protein [bacterium]
MRAFLLGTVLVGMIALSAAQPTQPTDAPTSEPTAKPRQITLASTQEGERWWWMEDAKSNPLSAPRKTNDASWSIEVPANAQTLWVYESQTGNLARLKTAELKEKNELTREAWTHVARVQVNLRAQAKPVASAIVTLKDSTGAERKRVLEPSAEGIVVFERVPLGKVEIVAQYGDDGKATQETTLKVERELRVPVIELSLSGTVATLEPKAETDAVAKPSEETPAGSRIGAIVMFVIALALAIGVIVFLVRLAVQKPQQVGAAMGKLGVELPQAASGVGSATATPEPQQPDLPPLDTAGVPPTATAAPTMIVSVGPATRLVATQGPYAGQTFALDAELMTIGREAVHPLALVNDMGVSRTHAQIVKQGEATLVEDLGSTNGTYVNGARISAPTPIKPGDTLQLGASLFRVE